MQRIHLALITLALAMPVTGAAQSAAPGTDGDVASSDSTPPAPKKKGGLFGKAKGLAKNKVLKQVVKTAACTMVPGGQVIASAIDGGVEGAAGGTAAGIATGQTGCMPGGGLLPNPASAAGEAAAAAGAAGLGAGLPGVGLPGMPTVPAQGYSPEQIKQVQEHYKKMGIDGAQLQAMQEMMAAMPGATTAPTAEAPVPEESPPLSYVLVKEKGRMVLRGLAWASGSAAVPPAREAMFDRAVSELAAEIRSGSRNYKLEVKVEEQGSKEQSRSLAKKRADVIVGALARHRVPRDRVIPAAGSADKDPRVIVSTTNSR